MEMRASSRPGSDALGLRDSSAANATLPERLAGSSGHAVPAAASAASAATATSDRLRRWSNRRAGTRLSIGSGAGSSRAAGGSGAAGSAAGDALGRTRLSHVSFVSSTSVRVIPDVWQPNRSVDRLLAAPLLMRQLP